MPDQYLRDRHAGPHISVNNVNSWPWLRPDVDRKSQFSLFAGPRNHGELTPRNKRSAEFPFAFRSSAGR